MNLGFLDERLCETCAKTQPFGLTLTYKYFHLYWIFRWVTKRQYWLVCPVCEHGWELETKATEAALPKSSIPLWDRYGLVALGALVAVGIAVGIANAVPSVERDPVGTIVAAGTLDVFRFGVGDCFNDDRPLSSGGAVGPSEVKSVPGVPCSGPHDNEVFALVNVSRSTFPGVEELQRIASELCVERFEAFVGRDYPSSALDVVWLVPTELSWREGSDREVVCAVHHVDSRKLVGSMKGSGM